MAARVVTIVDEAAPARFGVSIGAVHDTGTVARGHRGGDRGRTLVMP